ncbi:MAG: alpha/beta fold hydrolase [Rhodospirillales bacterium]|nr:alpha/beta fold hydrolase [Rhodospirillales bacterium]
MTRLAVSRYGKEGPVLVLLHGLFGSGRNWMRIARRLSAEWRVMAVDLPNHGESGWTRTTDYRAMAEAVAALLADEDLERVCLLGHSMGGKTAMTLALTQPQWLAGLVVADIAPVAYNHGNLALIRAMQSLDLGRIVKRSDADAALAGAVPEPGLRSFLLQNLVLTAGRYRWQVNLDGLAASIEAIQGFPQTLLTHRFEGPTLFLAGAASHYVRRQDEPLIRQLFPHARLQVVAKAGHWLHAENPEGFLAALQPFLNEIPA